MNRSVGDKSFSIDLIQERAQTAHPNGVNPRDLFFDQRLEKEESKKTKNASAFRDQFAYSSSSRVKRNGKSRYALPRLQKSAAASLYQSQHEFNPSPIIRGTTPTSTTMMSPGGVKLRGFQLYNLEHFASIARQSILTKKKTWQDMTREDTSSRHLVKREDIFDLQHCYNTAMKWNPDAPEADVDGDHVDAGDGIRKKKKIKKPVLSTATSPAIFTNEFNADYQAFQAQIKTLYSNQTLERTTDETTTTSSDMLQMTETFFTQQNQMLSRICFQQKWTDLVFGELVGQLQVSFLEQGNLAFHLRTEYGRLYFEFMDSHQQLIQLFHQTLEINRQNEIKIKTLNRAYEEAQDRAEGQYEGKIQQIQAQAEATRQECIAKQNDSTAQMMKMMETLKTLQLLCKKYREDSTFVHQMEVNDEMQKLKIRNAWMKEELDQLRPLVFEKERLTRDNKVLKTKTDQLESEHAEMQAQIQHQQHLIQELTLQQQELLAQQEMEKSSEPGDDASDERMTEHKNAPRAFHVSLAGEDESVLCIRCNQRLDAAQDASSLDAAAYGTAESMTMNGGKKSKRIQCRVYRTFLPSLNGARPIQATEWTLGCIRAILNAKQIEDCVALRQGKLRLSMPEFVYAWFGLSMTELDDIQDEDVKEKRMIEADGLRWAFYYGLKHLSKDYLEAVMCFTLLDEKYGEDELVFTLYCLRIAQRFLFDHSDDAADDGIHVPLELADIATYGQFIQWYQRQAKDDGVVPTLAKRLVIPLAIASHVTRMILSKATVEEQREFDAQLQEAATCPEGSTGTSVVDIYFWLKLMLQEYREEQAHRRAAIRLMFQTAASCPATDDEVSSLSAAALTMDMEQFTNMIFTLNPQTSVATIASLYRWTCDFGDGKVTFDAFLLAAEKLQFFSSCLVLDSSFGLVSALPMDQHDDDDDNSTTTTLLHSRSSRHEYFRHSTNIGSIVHKHFSCFESVFEQQLMHLPPGIESSYRHALNQVKFVLRHEKVSSFSSPSRQTTANDGIWIDGFRAWCTYRRLLSVLCQVKIVQMEQRTSVPSRVSRQVDQDFVNLQRLIMQPHSGALEERFGREEGREKKKQEEADPIDRLDRLARVISATKIQTVFRKRQCLEMRAVAILPPTLRPWMMIFRGQDPRGTHPHHHHQTLDWLLHSTALLFREQLRHQFSHASSEFTTQWTGHIYEYFVTHLGSQDATNDAIQEYFWNLERHTTAASTVVVHPRLDLFRLFCGLSTEEEEEDQMMQPPRVMTMLAAQWRFLRTCMENIVQVLQDNDKDTSSSVEDIFFSCGSDDASRPSCIASAQARAMIQTHFSFAADPTCVELQTLVDQATLHEERRGDVIPIERLLYLLVSQWKVSCVRRWTNIPAWIVSPSSESSEFTLVHYRDYLRKQVVSHVILDDPTLIISGYRHTLVALSRVREKKKKKNVALARALAESNWSFVVTDFVSAPTEENPTTHNSTTTQDLLALEHIWQTFQRQFSPSNAQERAQVTAITQEWAKTDRNLEKLWSMFHELVLVATSS